SLILDIADHDVRLQSADATLASQPGYARYEGSKILAVGEAAQRDARRHPRQSCDDFWHRLSTDALDRSTLSRADLANAQLQSLLKQASLDGDDQEMIIVVPGYADSGVLSLLLGILKANRIKPVALVDAAAAATHRHYPDRTLVHVDLSLHCASVARIHQAGGLSSVTDVRRLEANGLVALNNAWLKFFASSFVKQCRFDPLHSAAAEQHLADEMSSWLSLLHRQQKATVTLTHEADDYAITIERVDVVNTVAALYQRISDIARAALSGGNAPTIQLRSALATLPGFVDYLTARTGADYFLIEDGSADADVSGRLARLDADADRLLQAMPFDDVNITPPDSKSERLSSNAPTHIVHEASAIRITAVPLFIGAGAQADATQRMIALEGQPPGVSSLHCELKLIAAQCELHDHSRYGTFLNGNRISGNAVLQAGDIIRVGTPGVEFQLLTEGDV
ncbi:MAG: FHA domain-containing protein, partial [Woeseiaceae bacterium]